MKLKVLLSKNKKIGIVNLPKGVMLELKYSQIKLSCTSN